MEQSPGADKVPGFDPAAAPLSTDEEAAGHGLSTVQKPSNRNNLVAAEAAADSNGTDRSSYRYQDRLVLPSIAVLIAAVAAVVVLLSP